MRRAHDGGSRIVLLSAAPDILVRRIGEYIGYHEVVATSFEIHNTIYTGRVTGIVPYAAGKIAAASAYAASLGVRLSDCTAYANRLRHSAPGERRDGVCSESVSGTAKNTQ